MKKIILNIFLTTLLINKAHATNHYIAEEDRENSFAVQIMEKEAYILSITDRMQFLEEENFYKKKALEDKEKELEEALKKEINYKSKKEKYKLLSLQHFVELEKARAKEESLIIKLDKKKNSIKKYRDEIRELNHQKIKQNQEQTLIFYEATAQKDKVYFDLLNKFEDYSHENEQKIKNYETEIGNLRQQLSKVSSFFKEQKEEYQKSEIQLKKSLSENEKKNTEEKNILTTSISQKNEEIKKTTEELQKEKSIRTIYSPELRKRKKSLDDLKIAFNQTEKEKEQIKTTSLKEILSWEEKCKKLTLENSKNVSELHTLKNTLSPYKKYSIKFNPQRREHRYVKNSHLQTNDWYLTDNQNYALINLLDQGLSIFSKKL